MKISELEQNSKVINLAGTITQLDEQKTTPNGATYQEGILSDESGQVKITFWAESVGKYNVGDQIRFVTGWCKSFNNELQVSAGKFGKIEFTAPTNLPK